MTEQIQEIPEKPAQPGIVPEMQPQRNPFKVVLLVVLGLITLAGAVYAGVTIGKKQSPPEVIPQVVEASPTPDPTANWKTYKNEKLGFEFKYPPVLGISTLKDGVQLTHSIQYKHDNFCDGSGLLPPENKLEDFGLSIKLLLTNLKDSIILVDGKDSYLIKNYYKDGQLAPDGGFVKKYSHLGLLGYEIYYGNEGCGNIVYYLPVSQGKTLVIIRNLIGDLNFSTRKNEYLKLPGIISPTQEQTYFHQILSTFKFLE